ncbi:translocation/assembly module TamB domain-containing protein [Pseudogemmobacter sonorensis]|uniref:translocation/assembly module TamB domain-containing protein n=1 Tax=Pseudogemmobacter sonorensis TaxID=2989681 RepID=UPI00369B8542
MRAPLPLRPFVLAAALTLPAPVLAQEDDRSWLTAFLEDNLSGAGRQVTISGFTGALSSRATMTRLTIADDDGIWITLDDVVLDWSRSALLSGEVIINELSAAQITLERIPAGEETAVTPEATPVEITLPELPVSIDIGEIRADRIVLGEPVLGQPLEGTLLAKLHLSGGDGLASFLIERTDDGPEGQIALEASYSNTSRQLVLDLEAREAEGGIVASLIDLPGTPAAALSLKGKGQLDDFAAEFRLESEGEERLAGPISTSVDANGTRAFEARFAGNPAPLFLPEYAEFLGEDLRLDVAGQIWPSGRLRLDELRLDARALGLEGSVEIAGDGLPEKLNLTATLVAPDGTPVLLPIAGPAETRVERADLSLRFDATQDSGWSLRLIAQGLDRPDVSAERLALTGSGRIDRIGQRRGVGGTLNFDLDGLGGLDPAILAAAGRDLGGRLLFTWREGNSALNLPQITLTGADYGLRGGLQIQGLGEALRTSGRIEVEATDLSRFSALAGRPLGGAAEFRVSGEASALTGGFDLSLDLRGRGISADIPEADRMLAGESVILAHVRRDETGTVLESLDASAASLRLSAEGRLSSSRGNSLTGTLDWASLADLGGSYAGALTARAGFEGTPENARITLDGDATDLRVGQAEADRLLAGRSEVSAELALEEGVARLVRLVLDGRHLTAEVIGEGTDGSLRVAGRLADLALLVPEFPGAVSLSGRLSPRGAAGYDADLRVQGPAAIDMSLRGLLAAQPDLRIQGSSNAAIINPLTDPVTLAGQIGYDLAIAGGWTPANASGRVTLSSGRIGVPARGLSLEQVAVAADLSGGAMRIAASAERTGGGRLRLDGPLSLNAPYSADLTLSVQELRLRDPELYETVTSGELRLVGPLLGNARLSGRFSLGDTELRVPSTGFSSFAEMENIRHIGDSAEVRATRGRAGVNASATGGAGSGGSSLPDWALDLEIVAQSRVFVRGRGLDAELGGAIRVGGTLRNIVPSGGLDLVRGRLDILGRRLVLSTASLVLEGDFIPYLTVLATNTTDDVTTTVAIEGPANAPEVTFSANPEMPQEEVLAWLLFGRGLDTISAFQAAQLANAVATLAGRGGEGIMARLRRGFGFDDLDLSTSDEGSTSVTAGKYISRNVYTEIGVDQDGNSRVNLNLDLRPGVTVKGRVDSSGESGIGIFLERDY